MDSKVTQWRPGPTVCRCCLMEGCYKDISTEYFWMGKREVYAEMLLETLDLNIAYSQTGGPNSNSRLICEPCIARLRDASEFKKQVQECEKSFMQYHEPVTESVDDVEVPLVGSPVKLEELKSEKAASDDGFDDRMGFGGPEDDDDLDDQPLTKLASRTPKKEDFDLTDLLDNAKVAEKRKSTSKVKASPAKRAKKKDASEPSASNNAVEKKKKKKGPPSGSERISVKHKKSSYRSGSNFGHRANAELILQCSTAMPFRSSWSKFSCSYCWENFEEFSSLIDHKNREHSGNVNIKNVFYRVPEGLIKIDITDLKCKLCFKALQSLEDLMAHLSKDHNESFETKCSYGVMPFKRQSERWLCVYCNFGFPAFQNIKRHMLMHATRYVCECYKVNSSDESYDTKLKKYQNLDSNESARFNYQLKYRTNAEIIIDCSTAYPFRIWSGKLSCVFCRHIFNNPALLRQHLDTKHVSKSDQDSHSAFYKCLRKNFLKIDVTNLKCKICSLNVDSVEPLVEHLKKVHNKPIDFEEQMGVLPFKLSLNSFKCLYCTTVSSDLTGLVRHTSTHFLNYVCHTCGEGFITEQALNTHSKVPHENSFACYRCVLTFSSSEERKHHIQVSHTLPPYKCPLCKTKNKRFTTWDAKQRHLIEVHNCQPQSYECAECNSKFKSRSAKHKHTKKVHSSQFYKCKLCSSSFTSELVLENHMAKKHFN